MGLTCWPELASRQVPHDGVPRGQAEIVPSPTALRSTTARSAIDRTSSPRSSFRARLNDLDVRELPLERGDDVAARARVDHHDHPRAGRRWGDPLGTLTLGLTPT